MEEQQNTSAAAMETTTRSTGIRYGVIAAVIGIAYFLILNTMGMDLTQGFWSWFRYVITIGILVLAHKYYKDNRDGFMSYGQGIGISFWMGLISAVIGSIFTYIYVKFLDESFITMMKDKQIEAMEAKGMSEQQIDQAMQFASMFMTPEAILGFGLVFGLIGTVICGLIVTIFTQKKAPETAF
jgi:hypothetical protein